MRYTWRCAWRCAWRGAWRNAVKQGTNRWTRAKMKCQNTDIKCSSKELDDDFMKRRLDEWEIECSIAECQLRSFKELQTVINECSYNERRVEDSSLSMATAWNCETCATSGPTLLLPGNGRI